MSKRRLVYLSGGMSGVERADYVRRFGEAERILRRHGYGCTGAKDMTLGVKADSIIDELSRIIEPTVTIHFTDPSRAVTITPDDPLYQGEEITMLLMPMLVNE